MLRTEFRDGGRGLLRIGSGTLTGKDFIEANRALLADEPSLRRLRHALVLLEEVTRLEVSADDLRDMAKVAEEVARFAPSVVIAVVAPGDEVYERALMWKAYVDATRWVTAIFRSRPEAETWLRARIETGA